MAADYCSRMLSHLPASFRRALLPALVLLAGLACPRGKGPVAARVNGVPVYAEQLAGLLPAGYDAERDTLGIRGRYLDDLINKELFVQEAIRLGLEDSVAYALDLCRKGFVICALRPSASYYREPRPSSTTAASARRREPSQPESPNSSCHGFSISTTTLHG